MSHLRLDVRFGREWKQAEVMEVDWTEPRFHLLEWCSHRQLWGSANPGFAGLMKVPGFPGFGELPGLLGRLLGLDSPFEVHSPPPKGI